MHLVFAPGAIRTKAALAVPSAADDGRFVFLVPWEDRVYAGTTDTPYAGDLDDPAVSDSDRDYILAAVAAYFPGVGRDDVVASWAACARCWVTARPAPPICPACMWSLRSRLACSPSPGAS